MLPLNRLSSWVAGLPPALQTAFWMTVSAACYAGGATIVRHLSGDLPATEVVLVRNLVGLAMLLPWFMDVGFGALRTGRLGMHVTRGFLSMTNVVCQYGALALIPVADMAAITFLQPILGAVIAVIFLHEVLNRRRVTATVAGFAGALLIIRPGFEAFNLGMLLALGSALSGAVVAIMIKDMLKTESPDAIVAYLYIFQTGFVLIPTIWLWVTPTWEQLIWMMLLGVTSAGLQRSFNRGMAATDATFALPFNFSRLLWAALLGWLVFAEFPDVWTWVGGSIIFVASVYLLRRG